MESDVGVGVAALKLKHKLQTRTTMFNINRNGRRARLFPSGRAVQDEQLYNNLLEDDFDDEALAASARDKVLPRIEVDAPVSSAARDGPWQVIHVQPYPAFKTNYECSANESAAAPRRFSGEVWGDAFETLMGFTMELHADGGAYSPLVLDDISTRADGMNNKSNRGEHELTRTLSTPRKFFTENPSRFNERLLEHVVQDQRAKALKQNDAEAFQRLPTLNTQSPANEDRLQTRMKILELQPSELPVVEIPKEARWAVWEWAVSETTKGDRTIVQTGPVRANNNVRGTHLAHDNLPGRLHATHELRFRRGLNRSKPFMSAYDKETIVEPYKVRRDLKPEWADAVKAEKPIKYQFNKRSKDYEVQKKNISDNKEEDDKKECGKSEEDKATADEEEEYGKSEEDKATAVLYAINVLDIEQREKALYAVDQGLPPGARPQPRYDGGRDAYWFSGDGYQGEFLVQWATKTLQQHVGNPKYGAWRALRTGNRTSSYGYVPTPFLKKEKPTIFSERKTKNSFEEIINGRLFAECEKNKESDDTSVRLFLGWQTPIRAMTIEADSEAAAAPAAAEPGASNAHVAAPSAEEDEKARLRAERLGRARAEKAKAKTLAGQ